MQEFDKKKKIAFVLTTFVVGGVEKSFLDLLDSIDPNICEVTVFLPDNKGEWTSLLEEKCKVKYLKIENFKTVFLSQIYSGFIFSAFRSLFYRLLAKLNYRKHYRKSTEYFIRSMPRVKEKFDCAIAYQIINDDCVLGTLFRINAPKKAVWSHSYINKQETLYGKWYDRFDKLFCVSEFAKKALIDNFPVLSDKTEVFYNIINPNRILELSKKQIDEKIDNSYTTIVTVGRLSKEKGQDKIPRTVRLLIDAGYSVKWYLVGDGALREEIQKKVIEEQVKDNVIFVGNKNNPYPYISACDIYVQTSLVEGWGLTVSEAKVLQKPIVTTDAGAMSEQIQNGFNGLIVPEITSEALAKGISQLIEHPEECEAFMHQLQNEDVCHQGELEKLYIFASV